MSALALLVGSALAWDAGVVFGERYAAAWKTDVGVVLHPLEEPGGQPRRVEGLEGAAVLDVVAWDRAFLALVSTPAARLLARVEPERGEVTWVVEPNHVFAMARERGGAGLLLAETGGALRRLPALHEESGFLRGEVEALPGRVDVRTEVLLEHPSLGVVGASPITLSFTDPSRADALLLGESPRPIRGLGLLPPDRLVTVEQEGDRWWLTRWSLLHPLARWPFPLGSTPLPAEPLAVLETGDGVWVVAELPLQGIPSAPGVVFGQAMPVREVVGAGVWRRRDQPLIVALVTPELDLVYTRPPPFERRSPPRTGDGFRFDHGEWLGWARTLGPQQDPVPALVKRIREEDLPVGLMSSPGGSLPEWGRVTVTRLIDMATPLNPLPLVVAEGYLTKDAPLEDPGGELRLAIDEKRRQIRARTATFWGALMAVGAMAIWLYRTLSRRVVLRDQVLAAAHNPFRQDSPNNPARTPFAANSLCDDLLRTLDLNAVVVEAPQFSGKSALLRHLAWRLEQEGLRGAPVRLVRLSLYAVPEDRFWTELGRRIAEVYPEAEASEEVLELDELDRGAVEYLLDEVLTDEAPRLVLVLDDLDAMGLYRSEAQRFRGLLQVVPSHRMSVLGAGVTIRRGFAGSEDESPWFNIFQVRQLRALTIEELVRYLESRLDAPFSFQPDAAARVHALTEGRPLQVWHLCFAAVEQLLLSRRLTLRPADVDAAAEELRKLAGVFRPEAGPDGLPVAPQEAWERVVAQVAEARRRRAELLQRVAVRQQMRQDQAIEDFFEGDPG